MKLSREGKCIVIALALGERVTVVNDKIAVVMDGKAFAIDRAEFDFLESKGMIRIDAIGCRVTGRGRAWAKEWWGEMGHSELGKEKLKREKSLSRVRLRRGNRRGR